MRHVEEDETIEKAPDLWKIFVFEQYNLDLPMQLIRESVAPQVAIASSVVAFGIAVLVSQLAIDMHIALKVMLLIAIVFASTSVVLSKASIATFAQGLALLGMKEQQTGSAKRYPVGAAMKEDKKIGQGLLWARLGRNLAYGSVILAFCALAFGVLEINQLSIDIFQL